MVSVTFAGPAWPSFQTKGIPMSSDIQVHQQKMSSYVDPANAALPKTGFRLDRSKVVLVVTQSQNDFLSPSISGRT
jgi:hypothetical protein